MGRGYGYPTEGADRAVELMLGEEGIQLDDVYTGKALAALIAETADPVFRKRRVLFWNTFNSQPLGDLLPEGYDYRRLPRAFHRTFEA